MGPKEDRSCFNGNSANANSLSSTNDGGDMGRNSSSCLDSEKEGNIAVCRVCQCAESDKGGEAALGFLDITPPLSHMPSKEENNLHVVASGIDANGSIVHSSDSRSESKFIKFLSPDGKVFICSEDIEAGAYLHHDKLIDLGCSCKNDLSLAHYACALKWFISRGSTVCEICSTVAKNVRFADVKKVVASLNDYESLRERTATGELSPAHVPANSNVDPDAVAAIRRQRLSEISLWFNPQSNNSTGVVISQGITDQSSTNPVEDAAHVENTTTKWAVESTGILVATGLLTITLAWLIAPRVGKKTAKSGLHILLGGICALTVVIFLRFIVLSRIKYGPARYWAILFVFWFLVFGIWASRTHSAHTT